jgi:hypothetical protein
VPLGCTRVFKGEYTEDVRGIRDHKEPNDLRRAPLQQNLVRAAALVIGLCRCHVRRVMARY